MPHIVLLGDSVFDNLKYVTPEPDVVTQLQGLLPEGWKASLRAVDGDVASDLPKQMKTVPADATHLVMSVGGNDLLGCVDIVRMPVEISSEVFLKLFRIAEVFEKYYRQAVDACLARGLPLTVCTIYNGNFADEEFQSMAKVAVAVFNDVILRVALEKRLGVIELRKVCATAADFANPIEPSAVGGAKIAKLIHGIVVGGQPAGAQVWA